MSKFYSCFLLITPFTTPCRSVLSSQCLGRSIGCILTAGETEARRRLAKQRASFSKLDVSLQVCSSWKRAASIERSRSRRLDPLFCQGVLAPQRVSLEWCRQEGETSVNAVPEHAFKCFALCNIFPCLISNPVLSWEDNP